MPARDPVKKESPRALTIPVGAEGAPRVWAGHYLPDPARQESAHVHQFFELLYVEAGGGHHTIDGTRLTARTGDLFWMAPGQLHHPGGLARASKWIIAFGADAVLPGLNDGALFLGATQSLWLVPFAPGAVPTPCVNVPRQERAAVRSRIEAIARELKERPLGYGEAASLHLRLLLTDLARRVEPMLGGARAHRPLLGAVFGVIEARYRAPIGLREVAHAVGRSPAYLTDLVRRETGRSVLQWIVARRLAEARRLLLGSEASLAQIAGQVGYLDPKHLSAQFRRAHGQSPHVWRLARRGKPKESPLPSKDRPLARAARTRKAAGRDVR